MKKNLKIFFARGAINSVTMLFLSGGLMQTFLLEAGISDRRVSAYVSVMQIAEVAAMIFLSAWIEKRKDMFRMYSRFHMMLLPMGIAMLAVCFFRNVPVYALMLIGGAATYLALGLISVLEYKIPYRIMDMNEYGSNVALNSVITGIASLLASMLVSAAIKGRDFMSVIGFFIVPAVLMIVAESRMVLRYRDLNVNEQLTAPSGRKINLFTYKPFYLLALPNLFRGFATGTFNLYTTIGYHLGFIDTVTATYMVTIGNIVIFAVGIFYQKAAKLHKDTEILLISGILMLIAMPLAFAGNVTLFLCIYAVAFFLKTIFEFVSPVSIVPIVDYNVIGQYSAWRVALYLIGVAVSGVLTIPMVDLMGIYPAMIANGLCFTLSGVSYHFVVKALLKNK